MNAQELYAIHQVADKATDHLWQAWHNAIDKKDAEATESLQLAKGHIQALHEKLFPEFYENVTSEVAAQNRANDVKHEMD